MEKIIVSLTSYPARITDIDIVLECLCKQTHPVDKIVLYLSRLQFENGWTCAGLNKYEEYGFEIHWCKEDIGSHKKYYYALQEFPDDIVIVVDDDWHYSKYLVEDLMQYYRRFPNAILARRAHLILKDDKGNVAPYSEWWGACGKYIGIPRMDLFVTTGGGALFPPHIFPDVCFDMESIMKVCPYADDIWIKVCQMVCNVPTVLTIESFEDVPIMKYSTEGLYEKFNECSGNDRQWKNAINFWMSKGIKTQVLLGRLFKDGGIDIRNAKSEMLKDAQKEIKDFINRIDSNKEMKIYGAGAVAKRVYLVLRKLELHKNITCFVVETGADNVDELFGLPVVEMERNQSKTLNEIYLIALVDREAQNIVRNTLIRAGILFENIFLLSEKMLIAFRRMESITGDGW